MIKEYLKAGYPALCVLTQEPHRAEQLLICEKWTWMAWDTIQGIRQAGTHKVIEEIRDPVEAVKWLNMYRDTVLICHNLHLFLDIPEVIQAIQNGITVWKGMGSALAMISPLIQLKPEIEKFFTIIDLPLPNDENLIDIQYDLCKSVNVKPNKRAARAAKGLTELEAEGAFALSLIQKGYCSTKVISHAKSQMIRRSGLLEFWEPAKVSEVGGLNQLKQFIANRAKAYEPGNEHLPRPKGVLLAGIPGTGKSLSCKATANILGWPLIRLDIGSLKGSLVGESEQKMRSALKVIDAFGECVCWLDEVEKAFAGTRSSGDVDAGTTANMFSAFLTWMQETKSSVLVMATANDVQKLPPEFIRAGRFDAIFWVDCPTTTERVEIIKIMNHKYGSKILSTYANQKLNGWTGAEIEQLAKDSLYDGVEAAYEAIVPLSRTMREEIQSLKDWAKSRARLANTLEEEPSRKRKLKKFKQAS
jgi:hypothetical protein